MPSPRRDPLLLSIAQRIKTRREALGLTQEALAERLGIATKNLQRLERGGENPTVLRLQRIAELLQCQVEQLLTGDATDTGPLTARPRPLRFDSLRALGWQVRRARDPLEGADPQLAGIAVYDLRVAAGPVGGSRTARTAAWATPPDQQHWPTEGMFLAQVWGDSMSPRVRDRDWCLFRTPVDTPWLGKLVLVHHADVGGVDEAGAWQLKRIGGLDLPQDGGMRIRLESLNPAFDPVVVGVKDEREFQALGELVKVLR